MRPHAPDRWVPWALGAVVTAYVVIAMWALRVDAPLGHDESVYVLRGRDLLDGWSARSGGYWADYRAPGVPLILALPFRLLGSGAFVARLTAVSFGLASLILTWALTRRLASEGAAVAAAVALCTTTGFMATSTMVLADGPETTFVLGSTLVLLVETQRRRLRWSVLLVPILSGMAVLCRFGAPLAYGPALAGTALLGVPWWYRERRLSELGKLALTGLATVIVTWLVTATTLVTQMVSPLESNEILAKRKGLTAATGWQDFWYLVVPSAEQPGPYWSWWAAAAFVVGVVAALAVAVVNRHQRRTVLYGLGVAAATTIAVVSAVGQVVRNYLIIPAPFWSLAVGVGWAAIARSLFRLMVLRHRTGGVSVLGPAITSLGVIVVAGMIGTTTVQTRDGHEANLRFVTLREVSLSTGEKLGRPCTLVTSYAPQVSWYSGCDSRSFISSQDRLDSMTTTTDLRRELRRVHEANPLVGSVALLTVVGGKRQPPDALLERVDTSEMAAGPPYVVRRGPSGLDVVTVQPLQECVVTDLCEPIDVQAHELDEYP